MIGACGLGRVGERPPVGGREQERGAAARQQADLDIEMRADYQRILAAATQSRQAVFT